MRIIKKIIKLAFVFLLLVLGGLFVFINKLSPDYKGEKNLSNLKSKVVVYYDDNGVPHIEAKNQTDAYKALGYVHAQDRLWQMEVLRRIAAGRLSEIFGKKMVGIDVFMTGLGIEAQAYKTIATLDKNSESYKLTKAYLSGINEFIKKGPTPLEFYLLGIKKEAYTLKDVYNVFGYMSFNFAAAHKTDPLLNDLYRRLGDEYISEFSIPLKNRTLSQLTNQKKTLPDFSEVVDSLVTAIPAPKFTGSNSWVLGNERTKNGKVIFANDPHISYSQPSVWYQNHIKTPDYEMYGFNLSLIPFPLLGHNTKYAYGLTMFLNDDTDFYVEENNPENELEYKTENGFERYKTYEKVIKVKDAQDTIVKLKVSRHGPILNDVIEQISDERPIAMQWIYTKVDNPILETAYQISHSDSLEQFKKGVSKLYAPGLNIMYGDAKNNIAWFAAAKLYMYRDSLNRKLFLNGASGKDEIKEYINFEDNPMAVNPKWNYVYTANNQPDSILGKLYPGYYAPRDRAKRIKEIIEPKYDFTSKDVQKMLVDVKSAVAHDVIKELATEISINELTDFEKKALDQVLNWNGAYIKQDVSPTIYVRFLYTFLKNTFKDEMGERSFKQFLNTYLYRKMIAVQIAKKESVWWDNINTPDVKETKKDIVMQSFKETVAFLTKQLGDDLTKWSWSKVVSLEHEHPIGKGGELLRRFFNVGPFKIDGSNDVINNRGFLLNESGEYKVSYGASTRRVVDFSDIYNSKAILPTGQSGNRFSKYYKNQAQKYVDGEFVKMILNPKEYQRSKDRLVFLP